MPKPSRKAAALAKQKIAEMTQVDKGVEEASRPANGKTRKAKQNPDDADQDFEVDNNDQSSEDESEYDEESNFGVGKRKARNKGKSMIVPKKKARKTDAEIGSGDSVKDLSVWSKPAEEEEDPSVEHTDVLSRPIRRDCIQILGAREHNLKDVSVDIPKGKLVVFCGVSGSGKSSLLFDTAYAESHRQLTDTFPAYIRSRMPKGRQPKVTSIRHLSPAVLIDQKRLGNNRRSTVGTYSECYNLVRLLFARCGKPQLSGSHCFSFNDPNGMCKECDGLGECLNIDMSRLLDKSKCLEDGAILHPDFSTKSWYFSPIRNSNWFDLKKPLSKFSKKDLDKLLFSEKTKLGTKAPDIPFEMAFEGVVVNLKRRYVNRQSDGSESSRREAKMREFFKSGTCSACKGCRLNPSARQVLVEGHTIVQVCSMEVGDVMKWLSAVKHPLAEPVVIALKEKLNVLVSTGVGYINLNRSVGTLSGGEAQRVKMSKLFGCSLTEMMYVMDEPSAGLHARDIGMLCRSLQNIRDAGNSVLVVEHDADVIDAADYVIEVGPGPGKKGGNIVFEGTVKELYSAETATGQCMRERIHPERLNATRRKVSKERFFSLESCSLHNLKAVSVNIPKGVFVCVTGVAGSGKSSLIMGEFLSKYDDCVVLDQSAVSGNRRSNPATYTGAFSHIRQLFGSVNGCEAGLFSFNSSGACKECGGIGAISVEMAMLDCVTLPCNECKGKRYSHEVLQYKYRGLNIHEVLSLTITDSMEFFSDFAPVVKRLSVLAQVGLGYLQLGQPLSTLSGGEAQRVKLATQLHKRGAAIVMDEPTTGLHLADVRQLLQVVQDLVDIGNSVIVIEHNLDFVKHCDHIIDLGPGGGALGGTILAEGSPEAIALSKCSVTGSFLKPLLAC